MTTDWPLSSLETKNETVRGSVRPAGRVLGGSILLGTLHQMRKMTALLELVQYFIAQAQQKDSSLSPGINPNSSVSCSMVATVATDLQNGK